LPSTHWKTALAKPLSREKAKRLAAWVDLEEALETGKILSGLISARSRVA
jgi:ribosomal protein S1